MSTPKPKYYNLLISANERAWTGTSWVMDYSRVFEFTHEAVKAQFGALDDRALAALMALPTLFAYESYVQAPARVGRITEITRRQREWGITFRFDPAVAPIPAPRWLELSHELDISRGEDTRTHWAVKNVDLGRVLHKASLVTTPTLGSLPRPPKVFVSYSWDSPEHREWVAGLAHRLRAQGIEVILDQWHLMLGEDLAVFMAKSVRDSDRVLMICTEAYVAKARGRQGGVGYEQMLVTGQMLRDVGTTKFIPVVRQSTSPRTLPDELAGRLYADLSDGPGYQAALEQLVRDLHNLRMPLPPLGPPPMAAH